MSNLHSSMSILMSLFTLQSHDHRAVRINDIVYGRRLTINFTLVNL